MRMTPSIIALVLAVSSCAPRADNAKLVDLQVELAATRAVLSETNRQMEADRKLLQATRGDLQVLLVKLSELMPPPKPRSGVGDKALVDQLLDQGIKKISDTEFEIDRRLVDQTIENPMSVARGARVVPSIKNGQTNGFKLYAIRPTSLYAKLGLMNGDTIHSINGFTLTSPAKALMVYTKVKNAKSLVIDVTRRGQPVRLRYAIVARPY